MLLLRPGAAPGCAALPGIGVGWAVLDGVDGSLGLAVSGGGDSTALAVLLAEARPERDVTLLTVDHGLRAEAADDVRAVERLGDRLGRPVLVLRAEGRPAGSVQTWARAARTRLLAAAAERLGLAAVVLGHTLDDQAETLLLRLARGSGLRGLGGMRADTVRDGVRLIRPLLGVRREALRDALRARGVGWREDPSNADPRHDRVAMRRILPALAAAGLTAERLAEAAAHLARASAAVDGAVAVLLQEAMRVDGAGGVTLRPSLWAAPDEVRWRALAHAVQVAGGAEYGPRFDALVAAEAKARRGEAATVGRARVVPWDGGLRLWREARGVEPLRLGPGATGVFDGRFRVRVGSGAQVVTVAALGEAGARWTAASWRGARETAPGVFADGALVAAPTLGVRARGWAREAVVVSRLRG